MPDPWLRRRGPASPTFGDYASTALQVGSLGVGTAALGGVEWAADQVDSPITSAIGGAAEYLRNKLGDWTEEEISELSPVAQERLNAEFGSPEFWSAPFSSIGLKTAATLPSIAAAVVPAVFSGGGLASLMAMGATGGVLSAGGVADNAFRVVSEKTDAQLREESTYYNGLRASGMDESQAREQLNGALTGSMPLVLFALGAATSVFGVPGQVARAVGVKGVGQSMTGGLMARSAKGAALGGATEGIQSGAETYAGEAGAVSGGFQPEVDWGRVVAGGLEGAAIGAALGGAADAIGGRKPRTPSMPVQNAPATTQPSPQAATPGGLTAAAPPPPPTTNVVVGNPQNAPVGSPKVYSKRRRAVAPPTVGTGVSPEQQAAISATQPEHVGAPATTEAPAVTQPPAPAPVPVATASAAEPPPAAPTPAPAPAPTPAAVAPQPVTQPVTQQVTPAPTPQPAAQPTPTPMGNIRPDGMVQTGLGPIPAAPPPRVGPQGRRILESMRPEDVEARRLQAEATAEARRRARGMLTTDEEGNVALRENIEPERQGKNRSEKQREERKRTNEVAASVIELHLPDPSEQNYAARGGEAQAARGNILQRARRLVDAAKEQGITIPGRLQENTDAEMNYNGAVQLLVEARDLLKKKKPGKEAFDRFVKREWDIRTGGEEDARAERRAEGASVKSSYKGDVETMAAPGMGAATEEEAARNEARAEELSVEDPEGEADRQRTRSLAKLEDETTVRPDPTIVGKEDVETRVSGRRRGVTIDDGTETVDGVVRAKKASDVKVLSDEEKARIAASMGLQVAGAKPAPKPAPQPAPQTPVTPESKPAPKVTPKVQEVKARVSKAKAAKDARVERLQKIVGAKAGDWVTSSGDISYSKAGEPYKISSITSSDVHIRDAGGSETTWSYAQLLGAARRGVVFTKVSDPTAQKTPDQKVKAAAKETDRKPTEAQKAAGNYKKGHVNALGLRMAIETPKGGMRSGRAPDGSEWAVRMPAHYGHILGTEGVDGDPVDVFIGGDLTSDFAVILDQRSLETQAFDEHKVFVGFKNMLQVMDAYEGAFSDGRAAERVQDIRVVTLPELKDWLAKRGATKKEAGADTDQAVVEDIKSDAPSDEVLPAEVWDPVEAVTRGAPFWMAMDPAGSIRLEDGYPLWYYEKFTTRESFERFATLEAAEGVYNNPFFSLLRSKLMAAVPDVPVYVVTYADMERIANTRADGAYHPKMDAIFVAGEVFQKKARAMHVLTHEVIHAATARMINNTPALSASIEALREYVVSYTGGINDLTGNQWYGLRNEHELVAEAMSNAAFQNFLKDVQISDTLARQLGIREWRKYTTWDAFVDVLRRAFGLPPKGATALEAAISLTERAMLDKLPADESTYMDRMLADQRRNRLVEAIRRQREGYIKTSAAPGADVLPFIPETLNRRLPGVLQQPDMQEQAAAPRLLRLRTLDQIAQLAKDYFGGNNPVRRVADLIEMTRQRAEVLLRQSEPVIHRLYLAERQYRNTVVRNDAQGRPVTQWQEFASLLHDETMAGVFADRPLDQNTHLGKDTLHGAWPKAQHADLARRWAALPQDLKDLRRESIDFFTQQQNQMSLGLIRNRILKAAGITDPAVADPLAVRLHEGTATDADKELLGEVYDLIEEAGELAKIKGPYVPLMRRGSHVVRARYIIRPPAAGTKGFLRQIEDNVFEFDDRKAALDFARQQETRPAIRSRWVDKTTGEPWVIDEKGNTIRISKQDMDAEQRFRVTVQDRHVEFFDSAREALAAARELERQVGTVFSEVMGAAERRYDPGDRQADMVSRQMLRLQQGLERRSGYKDLTAGQKNELVQALRETSIRLMGATRIQSKRLPRNYVEGASRDLTRNMDEYAKSTAGYLAKLETQPELDEALKQMREAADHPADGDFGKRNSMGRSAIANEVESRTYQTAAIEDLGMVGEVTHRVTSLAFLDFLFSPAYSVVNALQPAMLTYPGLAARFGAGRAASMMFKVYDDIGGLATAGSGLRATVNKVRRPSEEGGTFFEEIRDRVKNADERWMLDYLHDRGSLGIDAGLEIGRLIEMRGGVVGGLDRGINYLQGIGRQMPRAVEAINRTVSALTAFRLEMARNGGDREAAAIFAQEATNLTQGLYSHTDAPPIFNHPLGRLTLQFKKYGQLVYGFMGHQIGRAIRNANPGDRAEALKTLGFMTAMHVTVAGTLGLPTEPFKFLVMGMNAVGVTELTWSDVEHWQRQIASELIGPTAGEALTRGVTRLLPGGMAFDLSSRVGLADVLTFGEPRSNDSHDIMAYFGELVGGAPTSMMMDWVSGTNDLWAGNIAQGVEKLSPLKFASNSIAAYRRMTEGRKSAAGYQTMDPYTLQEALIRSFGFTPGREAESNERRSYFYGAQKREASQRNDYLHLWAGAAPNERTKLWGQIEKWNRGRKPDERLTRSELDRYIRRRQSEEKGGVVKDGFRVTRRDRALYESTEGVYNTR